MDNTHMMTDAQRSRTLQEKRDAEQRVKDAKKRYERKVKEIQKEHAREKTLLVPPIEKNVIEWKRQEKNKNIFEGFVEEELMFEVKPGINVFTLKMKNKEVLNYLLEKIRPTLYNSPELLTLQKKANKILLEFISWSKKL